MPYYPPASASGLPTTGGTMTGTITSTLGTITANTPALTATQTWNAAGVAFKGIFLNVTNTASSASARLLDLQRDSVSRLSVDVNGTIWTSGGLAYLSGSSELWTLSGTSGLKLTSLLPITWASSATAWYTGVDLGLYRNAAGVLEINNGTAGTFRDLKLRDLFSTGQVSIAGTSVSSAAGTVSIGGVTRTTIGANGAASALTAAPLGYLDVYIAGVAAQIPYYNRGA